MKNSQISIDELPKVSSVDFISLHPSYVQLVWIQSIVFSIICTGLSIIPLFLKVSDNASQLSYNLCYAIIGCAILLSIIKTIIAVLGVAKKGYAIREHDLIYKSGLIEKKTTVVPFNRVQHLALQEGFLLRIFSLTKLEFYTAGGSFSDLKITGIPKDEAERIKAFVVAKIDKNQLVDTATADDFEDKTEKIEVFEKPITDEGLTDDTDTATADDFEDKTEKTEVFEKPITDESLTDDTDTATADDFEDKTEKKEVFETPITDERLTDGTESIRDIISKRETKEDEF